LRDAACGDASKCVKVKLCLYHQRLQIGSLADDLFPIIETYIGYNLPVFDFGSFAPRRIRSDCRAEIRDRNSEFRIPNSEL